MPRTIHRGVLSLQVQFHHELFESVVRAWGVYIQRKYPKGVLRYDP